MRKELLKYAAFFLMAVTAVAFTACEKDSDSDEEESVSIVGVWTIESVAMDITIDGKSVEDYFTDLGIPEEFLQEILTEMNNEIDNMTNMTGTLELKADGTYVAEFSNDDPEDDDTGVWELSADEKTLYIDKGTEDEMEFEIMVLTKNKLMVKATQTEPMEDSTDVREMVMTMVFTR